MKKYIYIIICIIFIGNLSAQNITGKTDKAKYMVGDLIEYSFSVPLNKKTLNFSSNFQFSDTLQLINTKIDTEKNKINYHYTFSSFIGGIVKLPEFQFYEANKTTPLYNIYSPSIEITLPVIDTTKIEVKPLKSLIKIPLTLKEILPFAIGGLLIAGIIITIIYLKKHKDKRPKILQPKPEVIIPEDEEALNNLNRLKQAHLLEVGQTKQHYIALSEILWQYIYRRFNVNAFEMTTSQIMENMQDKNITETDKNNLNNIFSTSDLVKFAKHIPDNKTNFTTMEDSENFINNTKRIIISENKETKLDNNKETLKEKEVKHE